MAIAQRAFEKICNAPYRRRARRLSLLYIDRHGKVHPGGLGRMDAAADRVAAGASYLPLLGRGNCVLRELADHAPINYVSAILGVRTDR